MEESAAHRIVFLRHAESTYSGVYPDITDAGIKRLQQVAREVHEHLSVPQSIIASPAVRAQGSADDLARALEYQGDIITEPLLSDMTYSNWPAARGVFEQCRQECGGVENVYDTDERFEDASIFEPRTSVRRRFYAYLKQLINHVQLAVEPQNILVISHFEVLNHFVREFLPNAPWLRPGGSFLVRFEYGNHDVPKGSMEYEGFSKEIRLDEIFLINDQMRSASRASSGNA